MELSAVKLHEVLMRAHAAGNRARLAFIETLATLADSQLYFELGCPSIAVYGERHFGYRRSQVYECLRVQETLALLVRAREAFALGQLSWTQLREITRVATPPTEELWITFAREHTVAELRAEVGEAVRNGRDRPREDGGGLPNLDVKFTVDLTRSEHHTLKLALEKLAGEMSERLAGERVELSSVLLHMAELVLGSEPGGLPAGRRPSQESHHAILYRVCTRCHESRVVTEEGDVVVDPAAIERVAPAARIEVITPSEEESSEEKSSAEESSAERSSESADARSRAADHERDRPNPPRLRRQLIFREGLRCANPHCGHRAEHGHHIRFRSHGGRTELHNETAVCSRCHALIHEGLLSVAGDPRQGFQWSTRGDRADDQVLERLAAECANAAPSFYRVDPARMLVETEPSARPPVVVSPIESTGVDKTRLTTTAAPALGPRIPSGAMTPLAYVRKSYKSLRKALVRLGYDREEAEDALVSALNRLHERGEAVTEERLVQLAFCRNV